MRTLSFIAFHCVWSTEIFDLKVFPHWEHGWAPGVPVWDCVRVESVLAGVWC
uniref:Uncharacterized protein n=1 Tax=Anguilla anguilla TaxID=7936 RepID=A0A0E9S542_ANGAN